MRLHHLFFSSLLLGLLAVSSPWTLPHFAPAIDPELFSGALVVPWALLQVSALGRYGRRGLWLLIGLPLIALWPALLLSLDWSCMHGSLNACI